MVRTTKFRTTWTSESARMASIAKLGGGITFKKPRKRGSNRNEHERVQDLIVKAHSMSSGPGLRISLARALGIPIQNVYAYIGSASGKAPTRPLSAVKYCQIEDWLASL